MWFLPCLPEEYLLGYRCSSTHPFRNFRYFRMVFRNTWKQNCSVHPLPTSSGLVPGIWEARDCCHFLHSTMKITLCGEVAWGGVRLGGIITSFALPHICDATNLYALLHFSHMHTYVMPRFCKFFCTSPHTSCYAVGSLALPHIRHATL